MRQRKRISENKITSLVQRFKIITEQWGIQTSSKGGGGRVCLLYRGFLPRVFLTQNKERAEPGIPDPSLISATPRKSFLDIKTYYKPTETFQYTHFTSCHPQGIKRGFIKDKQM